MMEYAIREYNKEDNRQVFKFWNLLEMNSPERKDDHRIIQKTLEHGGNLFVAENKDNEIIGSIWLTCDQRRMYAHHFGVKASARNSGVGTSLLQEAINYARSSGFQLRLDVHKENAIAKHMYQKHGFTVYNDYNIFILREM